MARITEESKRAVIDAADMVEVVSARTQLRKAGARYTGRCPFHEERTPSFSVNPVDKLYYCFGCGAGGDLIKFVRETEQLDFAEALEWLAERFRVTLEYEETSPQVEESRRRRDRLHALLDQAASFYERHLWDTAAGEPVRAYLEGRGLHEPVCREFRLGLSPGRGLADKARQKGFTRDELRRAGLTNARGNDYFPQRLMFPLMDARGRVVGFQARKLREDDPLRGKYVNSPEGELFHKSSILYGLNLARPSIAKQDRAVVVEGNTDVIALRQAGFEPVVASMGTALTEEQLKELQRLTRQLLLCFDADAAGAAATLRGMQLAHNKEFEVRVVSLPAGRDPADAPEQFGELLEQSRSLGRHWIQTVISQARTRDEALQRAREVTLLFRERSGDWLDAVDEASAMLDLRPEVFDSFLGYLPERGGEQERNVRDPGARLERDVLAACYVFPSLKPALEKLPPEHFDSEDNRRVREALLADEPDPELTPAIAELDAVAATEAIDETTAKELILRLRERHLRRQLSSADLDETAALQQKLLEIRSAVEQLA